MCHANISRGLASNHAVTSIDLAANELDEYAGQELAHALLKNRTLTALDLTGNYVPEEWLRENHQVHFAGKFWRGGGRSVPDLPLRRTPNFDCLCCAFVSGSARTTGYIPWYSCVAPFHKKLKFRPRLDFLFGAKGYRSLFCHKRAGTVIRNTTSDGTHLPAPGDVCIFDHFVPNRFSVSFFAHPAFCRWNAMDCNSLPVSSPKTAVETEGDNMRTIKQQQQQQQQKNATKNSRKPLNQKQHNLFSHARTHTHTAAAGGTVDRSAARCTASSLPWRRASDLTAPGRPPQGAATAPRAAAVVAAVAPQPRTAAGSPPGPPGY